MWKTDSRSRFGNCLMAFAIGRSTYRLLVLSYLDIKISIDLLLCSNIRNKYC